MRAFIALDLPIEAKNELKRIQELLKKQSLITGKFTEFENLHLTLKFLGEISEEQIELVKKRLSEIKFEKIECRFAESGVFSPSFIKIIWVKLGGRGVFELQKQVDLVLKDIFVPEARFMSHVTIARVKHVSNKKEVLDYIASIKPKNMDFIIDEFSFKKSELKPEGPVYEDIEVYKPKN